MQFTIARTKAELRAAIRPLRTAGKTLSLVPTMGALHAGHAALVREAAKHADVAAASIFVNPAQFAPNEDFGRYPRRLEADIEVLRETGCSLVYAPDAEEVYPPGYCTRVRVSGVSDGLETVHRPQFFEGVATVVTKLLLTFLPDVALFGEKDYQQLQVIKRLAVDLDIPVRIVGVPTVREADGLALSSRNAYLSADERKVAATMHAALREAAGALRNSSYVSAALKQGRERLLGAGFCQVDYFALANADSLAETTEYTAPARLLAAAWLGTTRLIDNIAVEE